MIKRLDLTTGKLHDVGFSYQYLVHTVKQKLLLISGQYQVPIYRGQVPDDLISTFNQIDPKRMRRPDKVLKNLYERGEVVQEGNMQLISVVTKNLEKAVAHKTEAPSLLHVIDKSDLKQYVIQRTA